MLRSLYIRDLALIEDAQLSMENGFVVWSGETGAGKSLLLSAIGLVLGAKADAACVRSGAQESIVTCTFDLSRPDIRRQVEATLSVAIPDDDLILTRRVMADRGRSTAMANGMPVSVKSLKELGRILVDYVGQHQTRSLLETRTQMSFVDQSGALEPTLLRFIKARDAYEGVRQRRRQELANLARDCRERELLKFELSELDRLEPVASEPVKLMEEAKQLAYADEIRRTTAEAYAKIFSQERSAHDQLARIVRKLGSVASLSADLTAVHDSLENLVEQLAESASMLNRIADTIESDPQRLERIEERLAEYRRLAARLGTTEAGLSKVRESHRQRLAAMEALESRVVQDEIQVQHLWKSCFEAAQLLYGDRLKAAGALVEKVVEPLKRLGLGSAVLEIEVDPLIWPEFSPELSCIPENQAMVRMLFRPNPGEPARPLERIASGGELSRLLLAILVCLADSDRVPTVILDEIDTGVGGRLGGVIGEVMAELSRHHQVLCVTHLPQIAAYADKHFLVKKSRELNRTCTTVTELDTSELRVLELAQMMRGSKADNLTIKEASAMLNSSRSKPLDTAIAENCQRLSSTKALKANSGRGKGIKQQSRVVDS